MSPPMKIISRPVCRLEDRPVAGPFSVSGYGPVFNAGLIYHEGAFHMFARAIRDGYRVNPEWLTNPGRSTGSWTTSPTSWC